MTDAQLPPHPDTAPLDAETTAAFFAIAAEADLPENVIRAATVGYGALETTAEPKEATAAQRGDVDPSIPQTSLVRLADYAGDEVIFDHQEQQCPTHGYEAALYVALPRSQRANYVEVSMEDAEELARWLLSRVARSKRREAEGTE